MMRVALFVTLALVLGGVVGPARATTPLPIWGVEVSGEDEFGNRIEGRAFFTRVPEDPGTQIDHVYITCEIRVASATRPAAALGINESLPDQPSDTDGCYLTLAGEPVFNAPGIGVSGEAAATSSVRNSGDKFYRHDGAVGGRLEACINARGLFITGGLAEAGDCGDVQGPISSDPEDETPNRVYFTCPDGVLTVGGGGWDTTPPPSVREGGGCGAVNSAVWEGTFDGALDSMNVEVHQIDVGVIGSISWTLVIDGDVAASGDLTSSGVPQGRTVYEFGIDGLGLAAGPDPWTIQFSVANTGSRQSMVVWGAAEWPAGITFNPGQLSQPLFLAGD